MDYNTTNKSNTMFLKLTRRIIFLLAGISITDVYYENYTPSLDSIDSFTIASGGIPSPNRALGAFFPPSFLFV